MECLLIDGYNIIFSWDELKSLGEETSLEAARHKLIEIISNYQGAAGGLVIVVFDAHKVKGGVEHTYKEGNIYVVYTKEAETADHYIERTVGSLTKKYNVMVATSDRLEQIIILGKGAQRISSEGFYIKVKRCEKKIQDKYTENKPIKKNMLTEHLDPKTAELLEKMRRNEL